MIKRKLREKSVFKRAETSVFRPNNDDVISGVGANLAAKGANHSQQTLGQ